MRKVSKWLLIVVCGLLVLLAILVFHAMSRPRPAPVSGTNRPDWLPESATEIFHTSQEGFGWWRYAAFTIPESDFREYAGHKGWQLTEEEDVLAPGSIIMGYPAVARDKGGETKIVIIPKALVYENLAPNGGGIGVAYDRSTQRAYLSESHR